MYDEVANSYAKGEIDKQTLLEFLWVMGASLVEQKFVLEAAEQKKEKLQQESNEDH